jgi:dephospho-CoA kinase
VGVPFVGLTGSLGAGKSTALAAFERLGAATLSTDDVVHELYETDVVRAAVRDRFGSRVFDGEQVNRAAVAQRVFADDGDRAWLEGLLWPLVGTQIDAFRSALEAREPPPIAGVVETALLFESGAEGRFDATIAVVADDRLRSMRVVARDPEDLAGRERRQLTQRQKAKRATYVVTNDASIAELEVKLAKIIAGLTA